MIKYQNNNIGSIGTVKKVYLGDGVIYAVYTNSGGSQEYDVCYAVVEDINSYSGTEFTDVFDNSTSKWYKLNNLNQYEEYGVYGDSISSSSTYYEGKLAIVDGYEYQYSVNSWVNVGAVSGSSATLPNVEFMLNYNAKNYNSSTYSISKTDGQLKDVDAVCNYGYHIVDHSSDGYISITGDTRMILSGTTYMSRNNTQTGCTMTIVSKAKTSTNYSILTNRGLNGSNQMNWMWRYPTNGIFLHGSSSYNSVTYYTETNTKPIVASVRTYYDGAVKQTINDWTNNGSYIGNFGYGNEYNGNSAMFCDYASFNGEFWRGDFYWVYMSNNVLTNEQIQQVIDYNEGEAISIYPIYYDEKSDPLNNLTFSSMTEATEYAYNNCVYDGMKATIDGDRYYFDSEDENGWVKILEPTYYTLQYLEETHTTSADSCNISMTPTVSGITKVRFYVPNASTSMYCSYIDLNSDSTQNKLFAIGTVATAQFFSSVQGYASVKAAADDSNCQWAYWVDADTMEIDIGLFANSTAYIGNHQVNYSKTFISFCFE